MVTLLIPRQELLQISRQSRPSTSDLVFILCISNYENWANFLLLISPIV
jgi:hypothetical protein